MASAARTRGIELTEGQRRAVDWAGGTLRVTGPAATGKTTALVERAARLVNEGVPAEGILFFVGDRRHALTLRDSLVRRLGRSVAGPTIRTFHAFAWGLLNRAFPIVTPEGVESEIGHELIGLDDEPVLLTAFDQRAFVRSMLAEESPSDWPVNASMLGSPAFAGEVRDFLLRAQERLYEPADVRSKAEELDRRDWIEIAGFYERYRAKLADSASFEDGRPRLDFAGVLLEARHLIVEHPGVLMDLRSVFPHLLVDDFEEANRAERTLLEALLPGDDHERSAVVTGDPKGSVFAFRGADPANLTDLAADSDTQMDLAFRPGGSPVVRLYSHITEEARGVVADLRTAHSEGRPWGEMAVILRDYRQLVSPLRRELRRFQVPFHIEGEALHLGQDPVIRPIINLFTIALRRPGYEELWPELLASDLGRMGSAELAELRRAARLSDLELHELCAGADVDLPGPIRTKVGSLCSLVDAARGWAEGLSPDDAFWKLWESSEAFADAVALEDSRKLDPYTTFADALVRFAERRGRTSRMSDFLDTLESAEFAPESLRLAGAGEAVTITTAHAAKGREFSFAVVAGASEGVWPDPSRRGVMLEVGLLAGLKDHADRMRAALEEEERLFRAAATRAKSLVFTGQSAGGSDVTAAEPSRFLREFAELPEENAEVPDLILTPREAETQWRRWASSADLRAATRLAAVWGLSNLPGLDPSRWWWGRRWTQNDLPVMHGRLHSSYSRYSTYENCALQYLLGQVLGLDPESTYQMAFGSLIHNLLEDLENKKLEPDLESLVAEGERRWRDEAFPAGAVTAYLRREMRRILELYLRSEHGQHEVIATERPFELDLNGWHISGRIDRIDRLDGGIRLIDYKTSNRKKWPREAKEDLQLATYLLACVRNDDLKQLGEPKAAELVYVRHEYRGRVDRVQQVPNDNVPEDGSMPWDEAVENRIQVLLKGIGDEEFTPNVKADCMFCKFKTLCPLWAEGEELKVG
ncbi:MAG: ATP-dependent helicase [Actinomycetota bacterium]